MQPRRIRSTAALEALHICRHLFPWRVATVARVAAAMLALTIAGWAQGPTYPYSVALPFTASTGTVTGYNMYRSPYTTTCGTFAKLNTTPFTATTYTDNNPPQGFYCYGATAVNGTQESGFSNIVSAVSIPPAPPTNLGAAVAGGAKIKFQWAQSTGTGIIKNTIWCRPQPTGPYSRLWTSTVPATTATIVMSPGPNYCAVTAYASSTNQSGPSNEVQAN